MSIDTILVIAALITILVSTVYGMWRLGEARGRLNTIARMSHRARRANLLALKEQVERLVVPRNDEIV